MAVTPWCISVTIIDNAGLQEFGTIGKLWDDL